MHPASCTIAAISFSIVSEPKSNDIYLQPELGKGIRNKEKGKGNQENGIRKNEKGKRKKEPILCSSFFLVLAYCIIQLLEYHQGPANMFKIIYQEKMVPWNIQNIYFCLFICLCN